MTSLWQCAALLGSAAVAIAPCGPSATPTPTAAVERITVLAGSFGTLGRNRALDITARLQSLCGPRAQSCQIFCSETSFGRYNVGARPICRVSYRCADDSVRSVEAAREERITLRCPEPDAEAERAALTLVRQ